MVMGFITVCGKVTGSEVTRDTKMVLTEILANHRCKGDQSRDVRERVCLGESSCLIGAMEATALC